MSFTLPSGTTATPNAKIRSSVWNAAFNAVAAALNLRRESTEIVPAQYGGTGINTSASSGHLEIEGGTHRVVRYGKHVGSFGAVGDGVTDDSAAIQAAVNSAFPYIHGEPGAIYRIGTKVTIPAMASLDLERRFNWNGATFLGVGGGLESCFEIQQGYPTILQYLGFENASFDGTVSQAFVRFLTGSSWYCGFKGLRAKSTAVAPALLNFHNSSLIANPGMFRVENLLAPARYVDHTVLFSKDSGALGDYDDFKIDYIQGGWVSTIEVEDGCNLLQSDISNLVSSGHALRTVNTGTVQNSRISRIYQEPLVFPSYATTGNFIGCKIANVRGWVNEAFVNHDVNGLAIAPFTVKNQWKVAYGTYTNCHFSNFGMWATDASGFPWVLATYRLLDILAGEDITIEFPVKYADRVVQMGTSSPVFPVTFVNGPLPLIRNVDDTLAEWQCYGALLSNFGQGVEATITLPTPRSGMRFTVSIATAGSFPLHYKAAPASKIYLSGTALDNGDKVSLTAPATGDAIRFEAVQTGEITSGTDYDHSWHATILKGSWVDGGA